MIYNLFLLLMGGSCIFQSPLSAPTRCWASFRLSKHRLYSSLSQYQSISQAEFIQANWRRLQNIQNKTNQKSLNIYPYTRGGQLFLLGGHFEKAAFSGRPYLLMRVEANLHLQP